MQLIFSLLLFCGLTSFSIFLSRDLLDLLYRGLNKERGRLGHLLELRGITHDFGWEDGEIASRGCSAALIFKTVTDIDAKCATLVIQSVSTWPLQGANDNHTIINLLGWLNWVEVLGGVAHGADRPRDLLL